VASGFVGQAWVQIQPSFDQFHKPIRDTLNKSMPKVGKDTGNKLGKTITDSVQSSTSDIGQRISTNIGKGLQKSAQYAVKVGGQIATSLGKGLLQAGRTAANIGGAAAAGVATFGIVSANAAMRVDELDVAMQAVGKSSGVGYPLMRQTARAVKAQGIEMASAQGLALDFARANLNMADASKLARVAQDAAVIAQVNSTEATDRLMHGIQTMSPIVLRQLGIMVDANTAYTKYAKANNIAASSMTAAQKQQAFLNEVLEQGGTIAGTYEAAMEQPGKILRSFPRLFNDAAVAVGQQFTPSLGRAIKPIYDLTKEITKALEPGGKLHPVIKDIGAAIETMIEPVGKAATNLGKLFKAFNPRMLQDINGDFQEMAPVVTAIGTGLAAFAGKNLLAGVPGIGALAGSINPVLIGFGALVALSPELRSMFGDILREIKPLLPVFIGIAGDLMRSFIPALQEVLKVFAPIIRDLADQLVPVFRDLGPVLADIAMALGTFLGDALKTVAPLVPLIVTAFVDLLKAIAPLLPPLGELVIAFVGAMMPVLPVLIDTFVLLVKAIVPVLGPLLELATIILKVLTPVIKPVTYLFLGLAAAIVLFNVAAAVTLFPIISAIVAIAVAVALVIKYWRQIARFFTWLGKMIWDNGLKPAFDAVMVAVRAVVRAFQVAWNWLYNSVVKPVSDAIMTAIRAIGDTFKWLNENVIQPVWQAIQIAFQIAWAIMKPIFWIIRTYILLVVAAFIGLYVLVVDVVWPAIQRAISFAWNSIIKPIFNAIMAAVRFVGSVFSWLWSSIIQPVWRFIQSAIAFAWRNIILPIFNAIMFYVRLVGSIFSWLWNNIIKPVWNFISAAIRFAWNNIIQPVFNFIKQGVQWVGDKMSWLYNNVVKPIWDKLGDSIKWVWERVIRPVFEALRDAPGKVKSVWDTVIGALETAWDKIKKIVGTPVVFVVEKLINPLIRGANHLLSKIGLEIKPIDTSGWPKFATGGRVPGGWGGGDRQPIMAEPGEWVLTKRQAKAIGYGVLSRLPRYAEGGPIGFAPHDNIITRAWGFARGGAKALWDFTKDEILSPIGGLIRAGAAKAFELGTKPIVDLIKPYADKPIPPDLFWVSLAKFGLNAIEKTIAFIKGKSDEGMEVPEGWYGAGVAARIMEIAEQQLGKPYVYAMRGPNAFDCSGLVQYCYKQAGAPDPGPTTYYQTKKGREIPMGKVVPSDMVFFGATKGFPHHVGLSMGGNMIIHAPEPGDVVKKAKIWNENHWARRLVEEGGGRVPGNFKGTGDANVDRWARYVASALGLLKLPATGQLIGAALTIIKHESGGNPRAINNWDINARNGIPSQGLMQVIPPTFFSNWVPGTTKNILDPLANIAAGINYAIKRYGSLMSVPGIVSLRAGGGYRWYDEGGWLPPGRSLVVNNTGRPEAVLSPGQWEAVGSRFERTGEEVELLRKIVRLLATGTTVEIDSQPVATAVANATFYGVTP
jgi:phage-related protein